jgi:Tfp pilus assembly protein PilF
MNFSLGWRFYMALEYDRAHVQLNDAIEMDPSFVLPHIVLGQTYEQKGDYAEAIAELEETALMSH